MTVEYRQNLILIHQKKNDIFLESIAFVSFYNFEFWTIYLRYVFLV